jgi:hypothetical protein
MSFLPPSGAPQELFPVTSLYQKLRPVASSIISVQFGGGQCQIKFKSAPAATSGCERNQACLAFVARQIWRAVAPSARTSLASAKARKSRRIARALRAGWRPLQVLMSRFGEVIFYLTQQIAGHVWILNQKLLTLRPKLTSVLAKQMYRPLSCCCLLIQIIALVFEVQ